MGWFSDDHQDAYNEFQNTHHEAKLSHEVISGAAAFELAKAYEHHCEKNGKPVDHATAKAVLAGLAGAAVDRLIETKGRDAWDSYQHKRAQEHATETLTERISVDYE